MDNLKWVLIVGLLLSTIQLRLTQGSVDPNEVRLPLLVDESNLDDGHYNIQNSNGLLIGAFDEGNLFDPAVLGKVSAEEYDSNGNVTVELSLLWQVRKVRPRTSQPKEEFQSRTIQTQGENWYNNLDLESPLGNSFVLEAHWRLRDFGSGFFGINLVPAISNITDEDSCFKLIGIHLELTMATCDPLDVDQQWKFVPGTNDN